VCGLERVILCERNAKLRARIGRNEDREHTRYADGSCTPHSRSTLQPTRLQDGRT
jgi:hypothetical protein